MSVDLLGRHLKYSPKVLFRVIGISYETWLAHCKSDVTSCCWRWDTRYTKDGHTDYPAANHNEI